MIKNVRQLRHAVKQADEFRVSIAAFDATSIDGIDAKAARRREVSRAAMTSMLKTLEKQIAEFESLSAGDLTCVAVSGVSDLPEALIKVRIGLGLTQKDLAGRLGVKPQQVQRWEHEDYQNIAFGRLQEVVEALGPEHFRTHSVATTTHSRPVHFGGQIKHAHLIEPFAMFGGTRSGFVFARGHLKGAVNDGAPEGEVSLIRNQNGWTVRLTGYGTGADGFYSQQSADAVVTQTRSTPIVFEAVKYA